LQGDWDEGLAEIASCRGAHPLALLQFFPSLLTDPDDALEALPASQRSRWLSAPAPDTDNVQSEEPGHAPSPPGAAVVLPYLVTLRSRLLPLAEDVPSNAEQQSTGADAHTLGVGSTAGEGEAVRALVDLALLRGWLQVHDYGALLDLLKRPNAVDVEAGVVALRAAGAYREAVRPATSIPDSMTGARRGNLRAIPNPDCRLHARLGLCLSA
jgi:hypothetical protein